MPTYEEIKQQIAQIKGAGGFGTKGEIKLLSEVLEADEKVVGLTSGSIDNSTWLIVCTPQRVVLLNKGLFAGLQQKDFLLKNINSIDCKTRWFSGEFTLNVSGEKMTIKNAIVTSVKIFTDAVKSAKKALEDSHSQATKTNNQPPTAVGGDITSKLKELAELKTSGVLTEEEFKKAKDHVLAGL